MKIVRVQYTTRPEFAVRNAENIAAVAAEIRSLNLPGVIYNAYLLPDSEEAHQSVTSLPSFKKFADELHASGLEVEPVLLLPAMVASSSEFF